jgi:hypothetical protein
MALKSLSFTAVSKDVRNPVMARRIKLIERLEEQRTLFANPSFVRISRRWVKVDGERRQVEKQQRVTPWWRTDGSGQITLSIKFGSKPIEFEKGKTGVLVSSKEKIPAIIETLLTAARAGELDDLLTQASKLKATPKKRAA